MAFSSFISALPPLLPLAHFFQSHCTDEGAGPLYPAPNPFIQSPPHTISIAVAAQPHGGRGSLCKGTIQLPPPESSWMQKEAQAFFQWCVCFTASSLWGSSKESAAVLASFGSCLIRRVSPSVTGFEDVASHQVQAYCLSFLGFNF